MALSIYIYKKLYVYCSKINCVRILITDLEVDYAMNYVDKLILIEKIL